MEKKIIFTVKLICKQLKVSIGDFSCVPVRVGDGTTSCSSSASNRLHEITLQKKIEDFRKNNKMFTFVINVD